MAYLNGRQTVRCGYCYEKGHNRNGCEKLKDFVKNNPTSYTAHRHKEYLESSKHRVCAYCKEGGHNRKKCAKAHNDIIVVAEINMNFRKKFIETMNTKGIGPGALLKVEEISGYNSVGEYKYLKNQLCLVTKVNLGNVCCPNNNSRIKNLLNVEYCNVYDYSGATKLVSSLDVPFCFITEKPLVHQNSWRNIIDFTVVSPGHFICPEIDTIEKQEAWTKDGTIINRIVYDMFNNHKSLKNEISNLIT